MAQTCTTLTVLREEYHQRNACAVNSLSNTKPLTCDNQHECCLAQEVETITVQNQMTTNCSALLHLQPSVAQHEGAASTMCSVLQEFPQQNTLTVT